MPAPAALANAAIGSLPMSLVPLRAILWRCVNEATFDTLTGASVGQYDIRLTRLPQLEAFFAGLAETLPTEHGGYTKNVPIARFGGPGVVEPTTLAVRFMGLESQRKDWYIRAQRPETAYPLWRAGRGVGETFEGGRRDYVVLLRDVHDAYHARWIPEETIDAVPQPLRSTMLTKDVGVLTWPW